MSEQREIIKPGSNPTDKATLQSYIQRYSREAIDAIIEILRTSRNESLRMGAAKVIIDKSIPDIKAIELSGKDGEPIKYNIISGSDYFTYLSRLRAVDAPSGGGIGQISREIQSIDLAQTGKKNNNGNHAVGKVGST